MENRIIKITYPKEKKVKKKKYEVSGASKTQIVRLWTKPQKNIYIYLYITYIYILYINYNIQIYI